MPTYHPVCLLEGHDGAIDADGTPYCALCGADGLDFETGLEGWPGFHDDDPEPF